MTRRDLPNVISVLRIVLVIPVAWLLWHERFMQALYLFVIAGCSDALDGYLAKRNGWTSWLGGILDPLADKLLLVASYFTLGGLGLLPLWLVVAVLARDAIIVAGATAYHFWVARLEADPTPLSKLNTLAQIVLVLAVVFNEVVDLALQPLISALIYAVAMTTLGSGAMYIIAWSRRAWRVKQADKESP